MTQATAAPQVLVDLSDFRPENKAKENFRIYVSLRAGPTLLTPKDPSNARFQIVKDTYELMHHQQTYDYAVQQVCAYATLLPDTVSSAK